MSLSTDLISQFVKATKKDKETKTETTVLGTIVYDGRPYVKLDGSDQLTPISTTADVLDGERVNVLIKNHTATVIGNMSSPAARTDAVQEIGDQVTQVEILVADKVSTKQLEAQVARIDNLSADNVTIKGTLTTVNADIKNLQAEDATIKGKLTANEADITTLKTQKLDASIADITYATIDNLNATNATVHNLSAGYGKIDSLIFGAASGDVIQTSFSNAVIAQLGSAQIKSAMIESVSADKIIAGNIITNNVNVMSVNGKLLISDETIQISDASRVRVQIGKDASGDYSINIWDNDGKLMFSEGGITDNAVKSAIIRNDMVSPNANIDAAKLDISSLFSEINGSTQTIKSNRIYLDSQKQALDVAFTAMNTDVTNAKNTISSQGTAISVLQGQITNKVWQQDINDSVSPLSTKYSTLEQTVNGISATVATHTTDISGTKSQISVNTNSINSLVTKTDANTTAISTVTQTVNGLTVTVNSVDTKATNAAKTATNYLNFSNNGLVVGNHTASTLGKNVLIDSDSVDIRSGSTVLASFGADTIDLGKNSTASRINLCGGAGYINVASFSDGGYTTASLTIGSNTSVSLNGIDQSSMYWNYRTDTTYEYTLCKVDGNGACLMGSGCEQLESDGSGIYTTSYINISTYSVASVGDLITLVGRYTLALDCVAGDIRLEARANAQKGLLLENGGTIYGKTTSGTELRMAVMNTEDCIMFGYGGYENSIGKSYFDGNQVNLRSKTEISFTIPGETLWFEQSGVDTYSAYFNPSTNGKCTLGTVANRWYAVYSANSTIQTSDAREKTNIVSLDERVSELFDRLRPVQYNFINGNPKTCYGLIAQEVIAELEDMGIDENELDLVHHDNWTDRKTGKTHEGFGIAYNNLIAMLIHEVQILKSKVSALESA